MAVICYYPTEVVIGAVVIPIQKDDSHMIALKSCGVANTKTFTIFANNKVKLGSHQFETDAIFLFTVNVKLENEEEKVTTTVININNTNVNQRTVQVVMKRTTLTQ